MSKNMQKDFINLSDFTGPQLQRLLGAATGDKERFKKGLLEPALAGKSLAMIFQKPSLRTRVSFASGMIQLGGGSIYLAPDDIKLGSREPVCDVARTLGRMCDAVVARTFSHELVAELARYCDVPVINALTDYAHPCQAMADLMTAMEHFGRLDGKTLAFIGDGNNVARSLAIGCSKLRMNFVMSAPAGYELDEDFVAGVNKAAEREAIVASSDPKQAAAQADIIYTDTWVSMGQEEEKQKRMRDFDGFQVNADLISGAPDEAIVMHCLPAYRGYEISEDVFEEHAQTIFDQAENRLHFQRSLLRILITEGGIR